MKNLLMLIIVLLSFSSCKKDPVDNTNKIVTTTLSDEAYGAQYAGTHTNGDFYVSGQGILSLNAQGIAVKYNYLLIHGSFYNQMDSTVPGGEVSIDTFHFSGDSSYNVPGYNTIDNSFFGRNIELMLTPPSGQAPQFTAQLYLPENLFAQVGSSAANILKPAGDTLFWNADPANKNGMIISFDYYPDMYLNNSINSPNFITKTIAGIPDNGSYIIPANILSLFPSGGYIDIKLTRDASTLVSYNQFKYILHSLTSTIVFNFKVP